MILSDKRLNTIPHRLLGRYNQHDRGIPYLFWSASGVEISFDGGELWIVVEAHFTNYEPWISVDIDGSQILRIGLNCGINTIRLFSGMNANTVKHVRVLKETQFMHEDSSQSFRILGFVSGPGHFSELPMKTFRFEFIGDSITSGEGSVGSVRHQDYCSWIFSAWNAYPRMVADEFNADFRVISQAGWGIVCDCENNPNCTIPSIYHQICAPASGFHNLQSGSQAQYDFQRDDTDVIIINLGTNDAAAFHARQWRDLRTSKSYRLRCDALGQPYIKDLVRIGSAAEDLLRDVRSCNPKAYIIWCYGMLERQLGPTLEKAVRHYREASGDNKIDYLLLPECKHDEIGSCGHPGAEGHKHAAQVIIRALRSKLG